MEAPIIAQKAPYAIEVEAGKKYFWCACGRSQKQPFCDGSHRGSSFTPQAVVFEESKTVYFCGCKHSKSVPFCDGSHRRI